MLVVNIQRDPFVSRIYLADDEPIGETSEGKTCPTANIPAALSFLSFILHLIGIDEIRSLENLHVEKNAQSENQCRMSTSELGQHLFPFSITLARSDSAGVANNLHTTIQPWPKRIYACCSFVFRSGSERGRLLIRQSNQWRDRRRFPRARPMRLNLIVHG